MIKYKTGNSITHRAGWILVDPWTIIQSGYVRVCDGLIEEVGKGQPDDGQVIDHGPGAIMPAFVNAHTHLELCALKGRALFDKGFRPWVEQLINLRDAEEMENLLTGAKQGVKELIESGTGVVGEISTLGITKDILTNSSLAGIWFKEYLGNNFSAKIKCNERKGRIVTSLAAHAPHTTSPELLINLKSATKSAT